MKNFVLGVLVLGFVLLAVDRLSARTRPFTTAEIESFEVNVVDARIKTILGIAAGSITAQNLADMNILLSIKSNLKNVRAENL